MVDILYRHSHDDRQDGWWLVVTTNDETEAADELESWQGPRLGHGDLVRVGTEKLYVFDGASGSILAVPDIAALGWRAPWLTLWETNRSNPNDMMAACSRVDRRKIVTAAARIVASALTISRSTASLKQRLRSALDSATAWANGRRTADDVAEETTAVLRIVDRDGNQFAHATVDALQAVTSEDPAESARHALVYAANCSEASLGSRGVAMVGHAHLLAKAIPLSVAVCAHLRLADPMPWRDAVADEEDAPTAPPVRRRRSGRGARR